MKILLTGFEKFGKYSVNPTELLANDLNNVKLINTEVVGRVIKLNYMEIREQIRELIDEHNPDVLLMSGQAGRSVISLEKVAINWVDSGNTPYNCGSIVNAQELNSGGDKAFFSSLPLHPLKEYLHKKGIPAEISYSAGSYGCNQIFYEAMSYLNHLGSKIPAGFVHVPLLPVQSLNGKSPTMDYSLIKKGFDEIIQFLSNHH